MTAIETKAYFEDNGTIRLLEPVFPTVSGAVRIIVLVEEKFEPNAQWPAGFLESSYGSCAASPVESADELAPIC
jgi:hypothetical protein